MLPSFLFILIPLFFQVSLQVGLKNGGNTCFANSVFQLLHKSRDFRTALTQAVPSDARAFQLNRLFKEMDDNSNSGIIINPRFAIPAELNDGKEHDAEELLFVIRSFEGLDLEAFRVGSNEDFELLLSLPNSDSSPLSLQKMIPTGLQPRPKSLMVNLQRGLKSTQKFNGPVNAELFLKLNEGENYRLKAFIEHQGSSPEHGHFVTFYLGEDDDSWYEADDDRIKAVKRDPLMKHAAQGYIYLYEKSKN